MPTQYFLPVILPAFEILKKSGRLLHLIGASVIFLSGLSLLQEYEFNKLLCYLQITIAVEIFLVILFGSSLLDNNPVVNIFLRFAESLTLIGIGFTLIYFDHLISGWLHFSLSLGYFLLLYREWRIMRSESININQTGVSIPNFIRNEEIAWPDIKSIIPKYHAIIIETFNNKKVEFRLRRNLKIEELQQIDEFCRQHLIS